MYRRSSSGLPAGDAIPFFHDGQYHLFHLESPAGTRAFPERVRTTWRHAVSGDLVHWTDLPPALAPGVGDEPDADGVWTGSVVPGPDGKAHIFYTGHRLGSTTPQTICHATSDDLVHWVKDERNPIIHPDQSRYESNDWRDPYVFWNEESSCYWMLLAARLNTGPHAFRGCVALTTSEDLNTWTFREPLYTPFTTYCPECPELFQLGRSWYLVYSRFSERAQTVYRSASSASGPFRIPEHEGLDGRRFYAAKSASDGRRRFAFGWVHDRQEKSDSGAWQWGGDFGLPRQIVEISDGELVTRIPAELIAASPGLDASFTPCMGDWDSPATGKLEVEAVGSMAYGLIATPSSGRFVLSCVFSFQDLRGMFGILLRSRADLSRALVLAVEPRTERVSILEWPAPLDAFWAELTEQLATVPPVDGPSLVQHAIRLPEGEQIACNVLVDGSLIEVTVGDRVCLSYRFYGDDRCDASGLLVTDGRVSVSGLSLSDLPSTR
jgi:beta-fructofuranosidase